MVHWWKPPLMLIQTRNRTLTAHYYDGDVDKLRAWLQAQDDPISVCYREAKKTFSFLDGSFKWHGPGVWLVNDDGIIIMTGALFFERYELLEPCKELLNSINTLEL
jgi:hypothetical protein